MDTDRRRKYYRGGKGGGESTVIWTLSEKKIRRYSAVMNTVGKNDKIVCSLINTVGENR